MCDKKMYRIFNGVTKVEKNMSPNPLFLGMATVKVKWNIYVSALVPMQ